MSVATTNNEKELKDYGKYWVRPEDSILSEVLDRTIDLDYLIINIIRDYFDLRPKFDDKYKVINMAKISNFSDLFLDMGAYKKLKILKELRKELLDEETTKIEKFENKFLRIYEIRNIFAHSKIPKETDKKWLAEPEKITWEELNQEHKELCEEIIPAFMADF